ncbi:hypothetical protein [Chromohalobacter sp. 48-RD10]|uniref:hypothetical protein n=1 Tax=Chromohalobacter sp. 48-RD10 TaxID=2994063 RepID=UPI002468AD36|nr:hypothetical protein [Chromohalobacter sp. 48-RD10]
MKDLDWIFDYGFLGMRFYDLPNFFICVIFVMVAGRALKVSVLYQSVLLLHCLLPFVLNGVLFPFEYMPDALKYWRSFNAIRTGDMGILDSWLGGNVNQAAVLFALMPFPVAVSPISLGFYNAFLYAALFFWLYRKQVFTPVSLWFFLLYPSMSLYTGMGLRDTFVFVFMVLAVQWAREGKWWLTFFPLYLLFEIKFQNFFILGPALLIYVLLGIRKAGISVGRAVAVVVVLIVTLIAASPFALPKVNKFRVAMYIEDGGDVGDVALISSPGEFVLSGLVDGLLFLSKPFPWEAGSPLQLVQAVENMVVLFFLFFVIRVAWKQVPRKLTFWLLFMALALSVYGLVVFNYGTAARYRYPFVVMFVLFVCADCGVNRMLNVRLKRRNRIVKKVS